MLPCRQIDQFRDNARGLGNAIELADLPGRIGTRGHHEIGPPHVLGFAVCLQPHGHFRQARFKTHFVGDHTLNRGHMSLRAGPGAGVARADLASAALAGNGIAVHVKAHGHVVVLPRAESQGLIEQQALRRQYGKLKAGRDHVDLHAKISDRTRQGFDPDVRPTSLEHIHGSGRDETNTHRYGCQFSVVSCQ